MMGTPVNPILVIRNNLPDYRAELLAEITTLEQRLGVLNEELETLEELAETLAQCDRKRAATPTCYVVVGEEGTGRGVDA